ncbi:MAG: patatin-like phospholipase family protein [Spirochaetes bacterium]|nr:patatin-like phospholipase family protein [Spirochaetota bacterium]
MKSLNIKMPINFVLSGGAAKGFIHIGVLKAFEEIGILPSSITGTSAGALFGALFAIYGNFKQCNEKIDFFLNSKIYKEFKEKYLSTDLFNKKEKNNENIITFFKKKEKFKTKFSKITNFITEKITSVIKDTKSIFNLFDDSALIEPDDINKVYEEIFNDYTLEKLKIPFIAVSTDINSKSTFCFKKGNLAQAIKASTAIPFIFPPVKIEDKILYDGGISSNLPVNESKDNFQEGIYIGVDLASKPLPLDEDASFLELFQQIISTSIYSKQISDGKLCDIYLAPIQEPIGLFNFELKDELINKGFNYIISQKENIIQKLRNIYSIKKRKKIFSNIFGIKLD